MMQDPLVFVIVTGWNFASGIFLCLEEAKGRPCHVVVQCFWYVPEIAKAALHFKQQSARQYPHLQLTYLCPTLSDTQLLRGMGIDALHVHQNAFIDERISRPDPAAEKKYSAVHIANVLPFKRHHLAWGVSGIAVITYDPSEESISHELSGYKNLVYVNRNEESDIVPLARNAVRKIVCESQCGLILSEKEGANYASTEYLLCGIPIVSTPSLGGRDEFFDSRHVKIVEPKPSAVERAVVEWSQSVPPQEEIRESVLAKCREHRRRLLGWLCAISDQDLFSAVNENYWSPLFVDKLTMDVSIDPAAIVELWEPMRLRKRVIRKLKKYLA
jgi:glycosyltransferase involved in cell wall biosynthesis